MIGLFVALATMAVAPPVAEAPAPSIIDHPDWARRPDGEALARFYPARALREEMDGRADISCPVTAEGLLKGCIVVSETPEGYGFGEAALGLAKTFRMKPMSVDGRSVAGGVVRIPIVFRIPEPPTNGEVVLQCLARSDGGLEACGVVSETPDNAGYGVAALRRAATFRLSRDQAAATPGSIVRVPMVFDGPPPPAPAPARRAPAKVGSEGWWREAFDWLVQALIGLGWLVVMCVAIWMRFKVGEPFWASTDRAIEAERDRNAMKVLLGRD